MVKLLPYDYPIALKEQARIEKGEFIYRVGDSGDDARGAEVWRREPLTGLP